ncbi:HAD family hydrolase [Hymenobacter sp. BRD67]|uniref:HAD family hydrolase n=1 Tax=Hymenobacter sp. BRD67 TaxID=2675877 RepID=UPI001564DF50|nr:HAD family hydrolase [Hymenobacter sp. BRD67]QKG52124.1 HAD family hydrolase [Hymenobacter sp. BRD67]
MKKAVPIPLLIAFDADDTLWPNQPHFDRVEATFFSILARCGDPAALHARLYAIQRHNMQYYGYGAKALTLSMIETAIQLTNGAVTATEMQQILDLGKELLRFSIELLPGVAEVLPALRQRGHHLMLLTKGDLFDQEAKLARSGLGELFDHVEIVSEKDPATYRRLFRRYRATPESFVMIGNSLKSDILPVAGLGYRAIHVPYHANWIHEHVPEAELAGVQFEQVASLAEVLALLP